MQFGRIEELEGAGAPAGTHQAVQQVLPLSTPRAPAQAQRKASPTTIKVIGVGGGGSNAVRSMVSAGIRDVEFIVANTDVQVLMDNPAQARVALGTRLTGGLGAGGRPSVGEEAANEDKEALAEALKGAHMVFITAGMGGGTGTGAAPIVAQVARDLGALTVAVVTKPFEFEGAVKMKVAMEGIERLRSCVDTLIVIPNQMIFKIVDKKTSIKNAFRTIDDVLRQGVQGIADVITETGQHNIDFADVKAIMAGAGEAIMGIGFGSGDSRAIDAAVGAIRNPLLEDACLEGAKSVLVNVTHSGDLTPFELQDIVNTVIAEASGEFTVKWGTVEDPSVPEGQIKVTVIATGFNREIRIKDAPEQKAKEGDFIGWEEWNSITERPAVRGLSSRNGSFPEELEIPTVFRERTRLFAQERGQA